MATNIEIRRKIDAYQQVGWTDILQLAGSLGISIRTGTGREEKERQTVVNEVSKAIGGRTMLIDWGG